MIKGIARLRALTGVLGCTVCGFLQAQVNVTTYHNDIARTGQNTQETILTPANVNSTQFGKLFTVTVDGAVYAQPLYLSAVNIAGGTHNVVYAATEHDSLYAIDADSGAIYWQISLIAPGGRTVNPQTDIGSDCTDIIPEIGITGTPVIDAMSGTLYVVAKTYVNGTGAQYLHAIDVSTAAEKFGGPVVIQGSVPGTAYDAVGNVVHFNPLFENQRPALLLENGHVVIGWASHCDTDPWHGWVMSYSASTLGQEAVFNTTANGAESGIWMSGGGIAADTAGDLYFATGNGSWNGTSDFGDSIVKLGPPAAGSFPVLDYFTPYNQSTLDVDDTDVASGGLVLLPTLPSGRQLLAQQGKQGTIYLLDRTNMGRYCINQTPRCTNSDPQIVQEIVGASGGLWGSPAYWNGNLYWTGVNEQIRAYSLNAGNSGLISTTPTSHTAQAFGFSAPTPSISSNGNSNAILWALDGSSYGSNCVSGSPDCLGLYAYDATNLANLLYNSRQAANNRDSPGTAVKFETPIIANGKVYVGTQSGVSAYGELNVTLVPAANPAFSPAPGSYSTTQLVALSDATPAAVIYYTTDGTTPTTSSAQYVANTPLQISATTTIQALAAAAGYANSAVSSGVYAIASPASVALNVNLAAFDTVSAIATDGLPVANGGIDGSGDAYSAKLLGTSLVWSGSTFALGSAGIADAVSATSIALPLGNEVAVNVLATGIHGNQPNQAFVVTYTDGTTTTYTQSLSDWHTPQNYSGESVALSMPYRLISSGAADNRPFYLYGYSFAVNSAKTVRSIKLPNNRNVVVLAVDVVTAGAGAPTPTATPTFSPTPGTFTSPQSVALSDSTPGAAIYYSLDGSKPTTSSTLYSPSTPLQISATTTIQAIAVAAGFSNSAVVSGLYTIASQSPPPGVVSLTAAANVTGIANNGAPVPLGGLDGEGDAYSGTLTGTSVSWSGSTFTLGGAETPDAVSSAAIALPAGSYSQMTLLATGVRGNQLNQTFVVTYTDGSTSSFTQSLSDWHTPQNYSGESRALSMAYRLTSNGAIDSRPFYLYGYSFAINGAKTLKSIALPNNRNVIVLAIDVGTAPVITSPISVNLSTIDNVSGIASDGSPVANGGLDGGGDAYSATLMGTSVAWAGATFAIGAPSAPSAASGVTIPLPAGNYSTVELLATGAHGNQAGQTFVVNFTDGSSSSFTQNLSDWHTPQSYPGESTVLTMAYRITSTGALDNRPFNLYGYSFAINNAKSVKSIALPGNRDVIVLSIDLAP
jgi:hypothetical protein